MSAPAELRTGAPAATPTALAWCGVFAGSLVAAAALAPLAALLLAAFDGLPRWPFSRVFDRVAMVAALSTLLALRRWTGWRELVPLLARGRCATRAAEVATGLGVALVAVGVGAGWAFATGRLGPPEVAVDRVTLRPLSTLVGALTAALIEEVFFRGLLLGSLATCLRWPVAALASSALYAGVHLLSSDASFRVTGFAPGAGFAYLGHLLTRGLEPAAAPPLFGLLLAGLVLALVVRRSGSLYLAIGLHAGWAASFRLLRRASHVLTEIPGSSYLATHHFLVGTTWAWATVALSGGLIVAGLALAERRRRAAAV